ncbi:MAG: regulatory iron-sulfur-containing complex subunit RicT [Exilispira sp.]
MYLYRCRLLYSKAIMDFYSNSFYKISEHSIVKVETKHGLDLAIFLNKILTIEDKEFEEILKIQATMAAVDESVENIDSNVDFVNGSNFESNKAGNQTNINNQNINQNNLQNSNQTNTGNNSINQSIDKINAERLNDKLNKKRLIKIEGKFTGNATVDDLNIYRENEQKEKETFEVFKLEIKNCNLEHEMKPVGVHYFLDGAKILFDFVADHRIDFRELVKRLAARYRKRIELHQIGVRDEARMLDGIFICGQQLCCRRFLHQLNPISIKMAEVQNAPLNTMKISGYCGRLLCCLAYESDYYERAKANLFDSGSEVIYNNERYIVSEVNVIRQYIKLKKKDSVEFVMLKNEPLAFERDNSSNIIITRSEIYSQNR